MPQLWELRGCECVPGPVRMEVCWCLQAQIMAHSDQGMFTFTKRNMWPPPRVTPKKFNQGHSLEMPTRASPSSWGWTLELSHPGMGFNAVPILAVLRDIWATWFGTREWQRHNFPKRSVGELGRGLGTTEEMFSPTSLR